MLVITGEGLKTLDAVRDTFTTHTIEPSFDAFEAEFAIAAAVDPLHGAVKVKIPTQLRAAAGGDGEAARSRATTVSEVLDALFAEHGDLRERLSDEDGRCGASSTSTSAARTSASSDGLDTAVADGAEVQILPAVAGG